MTTTIATKSNVPVTRSKVIGNYDVTVHLPPKDTFRVSWVKYGGKEFVEEMSKHMAVITMIAKIEDSGVKSIEITRE